MARRLKLPVARTEVRSRAAWRTAITQDVPLMLMDAHDRGAREARARCTTSSPRLSPRVESPPAPDAIKARRKALAMPEARAA